jgi:hypothetical protein
MKIKTGDRVRISNASPRWFFKDGDTGTIVAIESEDNLGVVVQLDAYDGDEGYVDAAMCEVIS